jgi:hypothetical protein
MKKILLCILCLLGSVAVVFPQKITLDTIISSRPLEGSGDPVRNQIVKSVSVNTETILDTIGEYPEGLSPKGAYDLWNGIVDSICVPEQATTQIRIGGWFLFQSHWKRDSIKYTRDYEIYTYIPILKEGSYEEWKGDYWFWLSRVLLPIIIILSVCFIIYRYAPLLIQTKLLLVTLLGVPLLAGIQILWVSIVLSLVLIIAQMSILRSIVGDGDSAGKSIENAMLVLLIFSYFFLLPIRSEFIDTFARTLTASVWACYSGFIVVLIGIILAVAINTEHYEEAEEHTI